ncbi:MAG: MotA/TolQ/ExbB proton channel family protein, partial [Planctomycetota bacterium]
GNAHKIAAIEETWGEHVLKGGPVMWPIFAVAIAALLVALAKWLAMVRVRRPRQALVAQLLESVQGGDKQAAAQQAGAIGGPTGAMLAAGAEHLGETRELVEEAMYEEVLATRLRLQSWLPFVAICATSAPLLGLLGTVTGIMNTFNLMTVFGTGDAKTLSSGISEALITTEYGLYVAIPSLMLHAFLSRRARGIVDDMERHAVAFLNQVRRTEATA